MAEGLALGSVVVALFTLHPLRRLLEVRPRAIFGKVERRGPGRFPWLFILANVFFFSGMVVWRVREIKTGAYFVLGLGLLIAISFACADGSCGFSGTGGWNASCSARRSKGCSGPGMPRAPSSSP
jgi:predicted lysophospholipase L1 biosynthesis ABC-type transport system permease subunit